jgi:hypothetical protein
VRSRAAATQGPRAACARGERPGRGQARPAGAGPEVGRARARGRGRGGAHRVGPVARLPVLDGRRVYDGGRDGGVAAGCVHDLVGFEGGRRVGDAARRGRHDRALARRAGALDGEAGAGVGRAAGGQREAGGVGLGAHVHALVALARDDGLEGPGEGRGGAGVRARCECEGVGAGAGALGGGVAGGPDGVCRARDGSQMTLLMVLDAPRCAGRRVRAVRVGQVECPAGPGRPTPLGLTWPLRLPQAAPERRPSCSPSCL